MLRTKTVFTKTLVCQLAKCTLQGDTHQTPNLDQAAQRCKHMVTELDHQTCALGEIFNPDSQREDSCSDPLTNYPCVSGCDLLQG